MKSVQNWISYWNSTFYRIFLCIWSKLTNTLYVNSKPNSPYPDKNSFIRHVGPLIMEHPVTTESFSQHEVEYFIEFPICSNFHRYTSNVYLTSTITLTRTYQVQYRRHVRAIRYEDDLCNVLERSFKHIFHQFSILKTRDDRVNEFR